MSLCGPRTSANATQPHPRHPLKQILDQQISEDIHASLNYVKIDSSRGGRDE